MEFIKCWEVRWKGPEKQNKPDVAATTAKHPDSRDVLNSLMTLARTRARTTRSGVEHTNHEATTPPTGGVMPNM